MKLSEKVKAFDQSFIVFSQSTLNLQQFEKKNQSHSLSIFEVIDSLKRAYLNS